MEIVSSFRLGRLSIAILIAFTICTLALPAAAHRVNIFAYAEGGNIFMESYFPDGKPVQNGKIEILNSAGVMVLEGTTDKEGKFSVPLLMEEDLTIVIHASMGHKNSFLLKRNH